MACEGNSERGVASDRMGFPRYKYSLPSQAWQYYFFVLSRRCLICLVAPWESQRPGGIAFQLVGIILSVRLNSSYWQSQDRTFPCIERNLWTTFWLPSHLGRRGNVKEEQLQDEEVEALPRLCSDFMFSTALFLHGGRSITTPEGEAWAENHAEGGNWNAQQAESHPPSSRRQVPKGNQRWCLGVDDDI